MSLQSQAAKEHIRKLLDEAYGFGNWQPEYKFHPERKWRMDYAVPSLKVAIELDGATFKPGTGHNSGVGLRGWREKNNAAMSSGWRVWHYAPEEVIKAGRKSTAAQGTEWTQRRPSSLKPTVPKSDAKDEVYSCAA